MITLYTIECEIANIIVNKLKQKGIEFEIINDVEVFRQLGFDDVPILKVGNNLYNFSKTIEWVNKYECNKA